jgi:prepilin-type processing-associated H-X9-DG protein
MRNRYFTLVELLVVIALVMILAAMLLPAVGKARAKARGSYCLGNMKQIMVATLMYIDENNENGPSGGSQNRTHVTTGRFVGCGGQKCGWVTYYPTYEGYRRGGQSFAEQIESYTHDEEVFYCPEYADYEQFPAISYWTATVRRGRRSSWLGSSASKYYEPSETAVILDAVNKETVGMIAGSVTLSCSGSSGTTATPPHNTLGNVFFWDGHGESLVWAQALRINRNAATPNTWIWDW